MPFPNAILEVLKGSNMKVAFDPLSSPRNACHVRSCRRFRTRRVVAVITEDFYRLSWMLPTKEPNDGSRTLPPASPSPATGRL